MIPSHLRVDQNILQLQVLQLHLPEPSLVHDDGHGLPDGPVGVVQVVIQQELPQVHLVQDRRLLLGIHIVLFAQLVEPPIGGNIIAVLVDNNLLELAIGTPDGGGGRALPAVLVGLVLSEPPEVF